MFAGEKPSTFAGLSGGVLVFMLAAMVLAAYAACFQAGFVEFDDPQYLLENPHIYTGLTWANVCWAFSSQALDMGIWGPLTWLSHMLDCQLFGLMPLGHHLHSILLHAANSIFIFFVLWRGTRCRGRSFLVAALFALHPLNVENVAWLSERKSLLCMFWSLAAVAAYGWYARRPAVGRYLAVAGAFTLALLSKPMAVTLPAIFLLLDHWPLRRREGTRSASSLRLIVEKTPLFALSAIFSWIAILSEEAAHAIGVVPGQERLMNALVSYVFYIEKTIWPTRLTCFYPFRAADLSPGVSLAAGVFLLAVTLLVIFLRRRRHLPWGWMLYLGTLLPVIGVFQIGSFARADRYAYLPLIGLFVILVWELAELAQRLRVPHGAVLAVSSLLLLAFGWRTYEQAACWHDDLTLFQHAHDVTSPADAYLETNLAIALRDRGRFQEALLYFRSAVVLSPNAFYAQFNLASASHSAGELSAAAASYRAALRLARTGKERSRALEGLAVVGLSLGDRDMARESYRELLVIDPRNTMWKVRLQKLEP